MTPKTDNKAIDFILTADEQRRNTADLSDVARVDAAP
jgi:hypothetical protein